MASRSSLDPSTALRGLIRDVPDFPEPGIIYKDITPLLADPVALAAAAGALAEPWTDERIDRVAGVEARGFIFGPLVARALGVGFAPVRKAGKLPAATRQEAYGLEYGSDVIEIHSDAVDIDDRVLVIDDVLATGGTAAATARLVTSGGAIVVGFGFLIELAFLDGRATLGDRRIESVMVEGG